MNPIKSMYNGCKHVRKKVNDFYNYGNEYDFGEKAMIGLLSALTGAIPAMAAVAITHYAKSDPVETASVAAAGTAFVSLCGVAGMTATNLFARGCDSIIDLFDKRKYESLEKISAQSNGTE